MTVSELASSWITRLPCAVRGAQMTAPLLATKLCIPPVRPELVPRPHLIERLNAGLQCQLTLVSAQAGSGKTTLIAEWLRQLGNAATQADVVGLTRPIGAGPSQSVRMGWVSLDADDDDPMRFLSYLIAALETLQPDVGGGGRSGLASVAPAAPLECRAGPADQQSRRRSHRFRVGVG